MSLIMSHVAQHPKHSGQYLIFLSHLHHRLSLSLSVHLISYLKLNSNAEHKLNWEFISLPLLGWH